MLAASAASSVTSRAWTALPNTVSTARSQPGFHVEDFAEPRRRAEVVLGEPVGNRSPRRRWLLAQRDLLGSLEGGQFAAFGLQLALGATGCSLAFGGCTLGIDDCPSIGVDFTVHRVQPFAGLGHQSGQIVQVRLRDVPGLLA